MLGPAFLTTSTVWHIPSRLRCQKSPRRIAKCVATDAVEDGDYGPPRYMPKLTPDDPIVSAVSSLPGTKGRTVTKMELLDSRWNGNEAMRLDRDGELPPLFAKINRVEDPTVFMSEAVGLTALLNAGASVCAPKPLHVGRLPRVGNYGPGAFMLLEWFDLAPFGAQRPGVQKKLAEMVAEMHIGGPHAERVHQGRFGFPTNNFLALTPMDNTWMDSWPRFFAKRLESLVEAAHKDKPYGRAPLGEQDSAVRETCGRLVRGMEAFFDDIVVTPSLLHGDLWIGNVGATKDNQPVMYDPACFYGHHEFDLALMRMYGGYNDEFWTPYFEQIPKQPGFEQRGQLYELYQYLNQINLFADPDVKRKVEELGEELVAMLPKYLST